MAYVVLKTVMGVPTDHWSFSRQKFTWIL